MTDCSKTGTNVSEVATHPNQDIAVVNKDRIILRRILRCFQCCSFSHAAVCVERSAASADAASSLSQWRLHSCISYIHWKRVSDVSFGKATKADTQCCSIRQEKILIFSVALLVFWSLFWSQEFWSIWTQHPNRRQYSGLTYFLTKRLCSPQ